MTLTIDQNGKALAETVDGITMPVDCSFEKVNAWIHGIDVQFEELQALCLGMAAENDKVRNTLSEAKNAYVELTNSVSFADNGEAAYVADQQLMNKFDAAFDQA